MKCYFFPCGTNMSNWGDLLTPKLIEKFTKHKVALSKPTDAELIGVGSILHDVPKNFSGKIWSTGLMFKESGVDISQAEIISVRGPLTRARCVGDFRDTKCFDAGLVIDQYSNKKGSTGKYPLGILLHDADRFNIDVMHLGERHPEIFVTNMCVGFDELVEQAAQCSHIISSSLHGCVLADSLGIPNGWVELSANVAGNGFKFYDYYASLGVKETVYPLSVNKLTTLDSLIEDIERVYSINRTNIVDQKKQEIMKSFERI